jgi:hypothetical protein
MKQIIFGIALAFVAHTVSAQALWDNVPIGASPAEVQSLLPQAQETSAQRRAQEAGALLELAGHEIGGQAFNATFLFDAERLQRVVLLARLKSDDEARAITRELGDSLRKRYGLDVSTRSRRFTEREGIVDREWLYRRISIRLQQFADHSVRLTYSAEAPTPTPTRGL